MAMRALPPQSLRIRNYALWLAPIGAILSATLAWLFDTVTSLSMASNLNRNALLHLIASADLHFLDNYSGFQSYGPFYSKNSRTGGVGLRFDKPI